MKAKKLGFELVFVLAFISSLHAKEQSVDLFDKTLIKTNTISLEPDSTDTNTLAIDSTELNKIVDIRAVFEKQNQMYSSPKTPDEALLRFLKKDGLEISNEALYWVRMKRDDAYYFDNNVSFRDTVIVDPMYLPIVFKGRPFKDDELTFYSMDFTKSKFRKPDLYQPENPFNDYLKRKNSSDMAIRYVEEKHPLYIHYSKNQMPDEIIKTKAIKRDIYENIHLKVESDANFSDVTPVKFIPERRYWTSAFESAVQFSQNYVSSNWHKGGSSNLNLYTKNALNYNYAKDRIRLVNDIEYTTTIYTATEDTHRSYKVGNDVFRLHNNTGYQAFNKWSYTFDTDLRTQVLKSYRENSDVIQSAFMAPFVTTFGLGMKYDLSKVSPHNKYKKLAVSVNLAPLSLTYKYSRLKDPERIDLGRHGFDLIEETGFYKNSFSTLGSNIKATLAINFSRHVSWQSRLDYLTSYENVTVETENTLTMAISRYFSTRIYLYLRYDDKAAVKDEKWNYFQINQLLSFGFNYKW